MFLWSLPYFPRYPDHSQNVCEARPCLRFAARADLQSPWGQGQRQHWIHLNLSDAEIVESSEVVIILKRCKISFGLPFSDIFAMGGRREAAAQCSYYFVKSVFLLQLGNLWSVWSIQMGGRSRLSRAALLMDIPCSGITETSELAVHCPSTLHRSNQCTQGSEVQEDIRVQYQGTRVPGTTECGEHWTTSVHQCLCLLKCRFKNDVKLYNKVLYFPRLLIVTL